MAVVNQVEKKVKLNHESAVKFQLLTHCFLFNIPLSDADLDCLASLAITGEQELNSFCNKIYLTGIFKSPQTVRNSISKAEKQQLVVKEGKSKKKICINPSLKVQTLGNILLDYKFLAIAS